MGAVRRGLVGHHTALGSVPGCGRFALFSRDGRFCTLLVHVQSRCLSLSPWPVSAREQLYLCCSE
jgi:hypothetical protein